jgi:N-methylhydantoinase A
MAFGGAGGLFATLLATESDIPAIVVPQYPGNFSAWGLLGADITQTTAQTIIAPLGDEAAGDAERLLGELLEDLGRRPGNSAGDAAVPAAALDLRYAGQEYSLTLPVPYSKERGITVDTGWVASAFEEEYERIFGHRIEEGIEIVAVRGTLRTEMPERTSAGPSATAGTASYATTRAYSFTSSSWEDFSLIGRDSLLTGATVAGPALIAEETSMTYLDQGFRASVHPTGSLLIERDHA